MLETIFSTKKFKSARNIWNTYVTDLTGPPDPDPESQNILSSEREKNSLTGWELNFWDQIVKFKIFCPSYRTRFREKPGSESGSNKYNKFGYTAVLSLNPGWRDGLKMHQNVRVLN